MAYQDLLSYNNHAFRIYVTWGGFLLLKLICMSFLTVFHRIRKGAVANPEDAATVPKSEIKTDEDVERVRRAHLNDLENIPAFLFIALMYILSDPDPIVAAWLIRIYVLVRFFHTIVYAIYPIRQPARALCFGSGVIIKFFMIIWAICVFFHF